MDTLAKSGSLVRLDGAPTGDSLLVSEICIVISVVPE